MTPLLRMVHTIATALLHPGELDTVEEAPLAGVDTQVAVNIHGRRAMGVLIGQAGKMITAIRHLARRAGKVQRPAVAVTVEVRNREESNG